MTTPHLYLNGRAVKGKDIEIQSQITAEKLFERVVKGELVPRNEFGEYMLKEPNMILRKIELYLYVIPKKIIFVEEYEGHFESITKYEEDGIVYAEVYNNKRDYFTGARISHAKQLESIASGDKYIYEYYKSSAIAWCREQVYELPVHYEYDSAGISEFICIARHEVNDRVMQFPHAQIHPFPSVAESQRWAEEGGSDTLIVPSSDEALKLAGEWHAQDMNDRALHVGLLLLEGSKTHREIYECAWGRRADEVKAHDRSVQNQRDNFIKIAQSRGYDVAELVKRK